MCRASSTVKNGHRRSTAAPRVTNTCAIAVYAPSAIRVTAKDEPLFVMADTEPTEISTVGIFMPWSESTYYPTARP